MGILGFFNFKKEGSLNNRIEQKDVIQAISFDEQIKVFESLGYKFNPGITKEIIFSEIQENNLPIKDVELLFQESPFQLLYYYLGWGYSPKYYSNNCIWYDIEFIDPSTEYITFMKRISQISKGDLIYSDISLRVDGSGYNWINFKVNGIAKQWKLAKQGYIDASFFQRFSYLTNEFKTNGRYTYFDDGGQQFVIDYATTLEQKEFIEKTGLKREWLGEGNQFPEHKD